MRSECVHLACPTRNISMKSLELKTPSPVSHIPAFRRVPSLMACLVAEKLKREGRNEIFEQETMEELEDEEGNVYNRKTYEDLKKQGLI